MKRLTIPFLVVLALLPQEGVGQLREIFGQVPGTVGRVPGTVGRVPGTVGRVPGTVGRVPGTVGRVPGTFGRVPGTFGRVPHSSSHRPEEPEPEDRGPRQEPEPSTIVIVHGAWGGGWAWGEVEGLLRESRRAVYRPTLTGLGERRHLASPDIGLDTHITDVVNVLEFEELDDVELAGEPGGGLPASYIITREAPGAADSSDSMADRARELGWQVTEMIADHNPQWSKPREIAELLAGV